MIENVSLPGENWEQDSDTSLLIVSTSIWDQEEKAETIAIKSILDVVSIDRLIFYYSHILYPSLRLLNDLLFIKSL